MCLKERKMGWAKGRFFTKLPFEVRVYQTTLEYNLKDILKYIPYQSMTLSGKELQKFVLEIANSPCLKVNLYFTKWCQNQDFSLTYGVASEIDNILGLKGVYTSVHKVPERSYCLFQDRYIIPEQDPQTGLPIPGPRCLIGLNSLGEGMNQKLWTLHHCKFDTILHRGVFLGNRFDRIRR